jgi:hypothetical protein
MKSNRNAYPSPFKMVAAALLGWVDQTTATQAAALHAVVVTDCICRACGSTHDTHRSILTENKTTGRCAVVCGPNCPGLGGIPLAELKARPELTVTDGAEIPWGQFMRPPSPGPDAARAMANSILANALPRGAGK